ncbi:MAG: bifunctional adenosylcobinamide kinase/adenosylcobinamide-phosphate guanylyltransferase [Bacteroidetes bacterium]|jgi:adenosylcobinamide kinase/adenosylcobinamide-phosphate guanylyltransferase|nr:bifunctional adenosylcobinamide kinase/adenosylcobinamide-phosphate guanylyltransferase [Bacteroidota bacterium]
MANITIITGGQRSGKTGFAQDMAEQQSSSPIYLATARIWDDEFAARIKLHQNSRGPQWQTLEEEKEISKHDLSGKTVLLDCVTLWLNNFFHDEEYQVESVLKKAKAEWSRFIQADFNLIVITNEVGMGIMPEHPSARKFADLQGWMNQYIAQMAQEVYLMVSGLAVKIK